MITVRITLDPNEQFEHAPHNNLMEACGLIPYWIFNRLDLSLKEAIQHSYQYGNHAMGGEIDESGTYKYPEDPDLPPLMKVERGDDVMYQYQYGIVAFKDAGDEKWTIQRMD